jgi:hypothetical protein
LKGKQNMNIALLKLKLAALLRIVRHPIVSFRIAQAERLAARRMLASKLEFPGCEGAMNAWPPVSGTTTGYDVDGAVPSSIRWGTDGLLQSPTPSGGGYAVVNRLSERELVDIERLPNGTGVNVLRVRIKQGGQWTVTVRDNQTVTFPKIGGTVSVVDAAGHLGTLGLTYTATVVENDYEAALKQPGERTLLVEKLTLIETSSGGAQS